MENVQTAIFNTEPVLEVDERLVEDLRQRAWKSPTRRFRLCLHTSIEETVQEMIVVHCRDNYSRPHSHKVPLTYVVLDGELRVLFFNGTGQVTRSVDLGGDGARKPFALRIGAGIWYMPVCMTPQVVFYETITGPFHRDTTNVWAPWSPNEKDLEGIRAYRQQLGIPHEA